MTLFLLGTVSTAGSLSTVNTLGISRSADDLVSNPGQVANTTTADQDDRVFLKIVAFARNVHGDFFAVGQSNPSDLPQGRVRLLWGHRFDQQAYALLLWASLQDWALGRLVLNDAIASN